MQSPPCSRAPPSDTDMGFVVVLHLAAEQAACCRNCWSARPPCRSHWLWMARPLPPNTVHVIPPNRTPTIHDSRMVLSPLEDGTRHLIDRCFDSLAFAQGHRAIGVVLSGAGNDGTLGLGSIRAVGGITFAQDSSAQHDSMPRSAVAAGWRTS